MLGFKQSAKPSFYGCFSGHAETLLQVPFGAKTNLDQITALEVLKQKAVRGAQPVGEVFLERPLPKPVFPRAHLINGQYGSVGCDKFLEQDVNIIDIRLELFSRLVGVFTKKR